MDYAQIEEKFKSLKLKFLSGELDEAAFNAQLEELMVQDESGRWWMIGFDMGHWYVHNGAAWQRAEPPGPGSQEAARTSPEKAKAEKAESSPGLVAAVEKAKSEGGDPIRPIPFYVEKVKMSPLPQAREVKKMGWVFWLGWIGSIVAGIAILIGFVNIFTHTSAVWIFTIGVGSTGFLQWLMLRRYVQNAWWWLAANVVYGLIIGWLVGSTANSYSSFTETLSIILMIAYPIINPIAGPLWVASKRGPA